MKKLFVGAWRVFWDDTVRDTRLPLKIWALIFLPVSYICCLVVFAAVENVRDERQKS